MKDVINYRIRKLASSPINIIFNKFLGLLIILLGIVFIILSTKQFFLGKKSEVWPSTNGTIIKSDINIFKDVDGNTTRNLELLYVYEIGGRKFKNNVIRLESIFNSGDGDIESVQSLYSKGKVIDVYYSPNNPSLSCLVKGVSGGTYITFCIGVFFFLIGIYLILRVLNMKKTPLFLV